VRRGWLAHRQLRATAGLASLRAANGAHVESPDDVAVTAEPLDEEEVPLALLTADATAAIEQLRADARAAAEASRAPSSERAYAADSRQVCRSPMRKVSQLCCPVRLISDRCPGGRPRCSTGNVKVNI
jgi:hypothetical protein